MIGQFVITLREGFEAILLVAILIAYLRKTGRIEDLRYAYYGVVAALLAGAVAALGIMILYGGLSEERKQIFEGVAAFLAAGVLTYMILWMAGRDVRSEIESKTQKAFGWGVTLIAFIFVVREVIETILFLTPFITQSFMETILGAVSGIAVALVLSLGIFRFEYRLSLRKFFYITSIMLAFIASGLIGYGTHEFIEALEERGYESWLFEEAYSLGIDKNNPLHHKNAIGGIFSVLIGYSSSMEYLRVFLQFGYLAAAILMIYLSYSGYREKKADEKAVPF